MRRVARVLVVGFLLPLAGVGLPASDSPLEPDAPALTADERDRLSPRHLTFLEEVALLITPREQEAFLGLRRDYQRDAFIRRFWAARDPYPETARNELAERWETRLAQARDRFESLDDDRSKVLLVLGPPRETTRAICPGILKPLELWSYEDAGPIRGSFTLVFVRTGGVDDPWDLWYPTAGLRPVLSGSVGFDPQADLARLIDESCPRGSELVVALSSSVDLESAGAQGVRFLSDPSDEWLGSFLATSTDVPPGAPELPGTLTFSFPGRRGSRTVVQGLVSVPRDEAGIVTIGQRRSYDFLVDGEVLRDGELFDQFRYRFDFAEARAPAEAFPLIIQRPLRPGTYQLVLKVEDVGGPAYLRREVEIQVPKVERAVERPTVVVETLEGAAAASALATQAQLDAELAEANANLSRDARGADPAEPIDEETADHLVRILPPPERLQTGKLRVEALTEGPDVARVAFSLDGRRILAKTRPPYSVELDLGEAPRTHRLEAVAEARDGSELARDQIVVNAGPHRFGVRLVEPRDGGSYRRSLKANAVVDVPEGERLERVEIWVDEQRVATLYSHPFVQPLLLPPEAEAGEMVYVRAVAYLEGGASAEDVVFVNTPDYLEEMEIDLVELYTSVLDRRGRPVEGLGAEDFRVFENGEAQEIRRFELVKDLPIYAGVLLDTSTSMLEQIDEAVDAAVTFFETVITPRDRAAVITFDDEPQLAVRFTSDLDTLAGSLAGIDPRGETALWDSVVYGLYYFAGTQGKRVIVLISDGEDSRSRYRFDDALDYARRTGVAIYTVGLGFDTRQSEARSHLTTLANETGGRSFFIQRVSQLEGVYTEIEDELRSQYLLAYQSAQPPAGSEEADEFREIRVEVDAAGAEAKTVKGYYP